MLLLSLLFIFVSASLGIAHPTAKHWEDMRTKHSWHSIPERWEHHGHPHSWATIDLRIALKPRRESALIDALYEVSDPKHPKCVPIPLYRCTFFPTYAYGCHTDMARTYLRAKLQSSSRRIRALLNSSVPGSHTTESSPLRYQSHTVAVGSQSLKYLWPRQMPSSVHRISSIAILRQTRSFFARLAMLSPLPCTNT